MRFGKKLNVVEVKKTRSCVVRLEKVSKNSPNVSPSEEETNNKTRIIRLSSSGMGASGKGRRGGITSQTEEKTFATSAKRKIVGVNTSTHTQQQQKGSNSDMSNIRSNQKVKIIPRSNKTTPASTPSRDETPPPTIAAGRSRRAIKPNPKYASEDMVTPKVVRNVAMMASSSSRGGSGHRARKSSSSSDDFYNRNSEDEYENDMDHLDNDDENDEDLHNDKAYQASEKDEQDSDFSVIEEPVRAPRGRGRPKRSQDTAQSGTTTQHINKLPAQTTNTKRMSTTGNSSNLRSAPSQLLQIRRSLASANAQRNLNLLAGSGSGMGQKRKLEQSQDLSDNESGFSSKRKQLLLSNSSGLKLKVPVRDNRVSVSSNSIIRSRLSTQPQANKIQLQQTINGSNKISNTQATSRRAIEIAAKTNSEATVKSSLKHSTSAANTNTTNKMQNQITTQSKTLATKALRFRSSSPKLPVQKEKQNNGAAISISSSGSSSSSSLNINSKGSNKIKTHVSQPTMKSKSQTSHTSSNLKSESLRDVKDDSPNSTMDDFETMPTFTIVNVNDIINKKGDVLITKAKLNNNNNKSNPIIEFSESISLDEEDEDNNNNDDVEDGDETVLTPVRSKQALAKKSQKLPTLNNRKQFENKKLLQNRSSESSNQAPQILNHKLGLRNSRIAAKTTTLTATLNSPDKPAPRILNSMVAKKTQPVKPMIANMEDSADESFPLSLDEDEDEDVEQVSDNDIEIRNKKVVNVNDKTRIRHELMDIDTEDTESQNTEENDVVLQTSNPNSSASKISASKVVALAPKQTSGPQRRRRAPQISNNPFIVSSNKKRLTPAAAKENSLAAINQQVKDVVSTAAKQSIPSTLQTRKTSHEKVVISKQGDKIIKKITCFETWYVINMPAEQKRPTIMKNQLEMPLIRLANLAKNICLPNDMWSSKVTLYELSPQSLAKGTFVTYTGDLFEHNINEEDRGKYQPSCVMFRRSIDKNQVSRMPYDRAVIFKNKTFYTNIEGKNVRLVGAPSIINSESEIEILLEVVNNLTLQSEFVEHISIVQ